MQVVLFAGTLRKKALEALLEGCDVPKQYRGPIAVAVNKFMEDFVMQPKPGWKTTEFWMSLFAHAGVVLGVVGGFLPPAVAAAASTVIQAGYNISRGLAKQGGSGPVSVVATDGGTATATSTSTK